MGLWAYEYMILLFAVTILTYASAHLIKSKSRYKKAWLLVGLTGLLGSLFIYKYFNFFSSFAGGPTLTLLLPIGISFYVFTASGYLIDVYRSKENIVENFGRLALFLSFFPNVTAGPIESAKRLMPQFVIKKTFSYRRSVSGLQLFTFGLFKKVVIADNLGVVVDRVFNNPSEYKGLSLVLAVIFFTWQIYADFSGYTDMARGIARLLGFELLENFNAPYLATSVRDFWRRWHISLSSWFRDYVYIPLGGSRGGIWHTCFNILAVFALTGLWHGAAWTFVLWGSIFGVILSWERLMMLYFPKVKVHSAVGWLYTYSVVSVAWVLFRSNSFSEARYIFRESFSGLRHFVSIQYVWATLVQLFKSNVFEIFFTLGCLIAIVVLELTLRGKQIADVLPNFSKPLRWTIYSVTILAIIMLRNSSIPQFIYYQF